VAEGVEDAEVWTLLAGMGCDEAQGFLLARPVPALEMRTILEGRASVSVP
jgi:EAL domain-containing protein (putative c-di-GMP-specific phosphodiesterase class I)